MRGSTPPIEGRTRGSGDTSGGTEANCDANGEPLAPATLLTRRWAERRIRVAAAAPALPSRTAREEEATL